MGNGERQGRRTLVDHARQAIAAANKATGLANDCNVAIVDAQTKHNTLARKVGDDIALINNNLAGLKTRADGQRAWIQKVEDANRALSGEVTDLRLRINAFRSMTFWQRMLWSFLGRNFITVVNGQYAVVGEVTASSTTVDHSKPTTIIAGSSPVSGPGGALTGYIPHAGLGPKVLP